MKNPLFLTLVASLLLALPQSLGAEEKNAPQRGMKVHVLSPRTGAELTAGADRITIVVEVEDSSEQGIKLNKGIPVFDTPIRKDGTILQPVKENLDAFLKNLVGVTTYTLPRRPGRPATTVYQLTSVIRTALLGGGCQHPVYPTNLELPTSGQTTFFPSEYVEGAGFQFRVAGFPNGSDKEEAFSPRLCIVLPSGPNS